ncbi:hypothetical protein B0H11DRAFT_2121817 [Mycena galericulata]|nr:hypothetical protein B0H11DRAFT_2121817 [Mycena galericulata]
MQSAPDIPALRRLLSEIDDEMAALQAKLARLAAARKPILKTLQSVVYPVLTLPPELTAQIFTHCVDTAHIGRFGTLPHLRVPPSRDGGNGPLILASVCRAWRDIALALGPIWSSFGLFTLEDSVPNTEKLLQCWLPRAGVHPLDIDLEEPSTTGPLCTLLAPYSPQWRKLSCTMRTPISFPSDLIRGRIPLLRTLEIELQVRREDLNAPPTQVTAFADAPQLREVYLYEFTLPWISLPWTQLTSLRLSGQSSAECVEILGQTPNLEILQVHHLLDHHPAMPPPPPGPPVRLDHLHTLILWEAHTDFFPHIAFPALTHLELTDVVDGMIPQLASFLARSACRLSSVTLFATQLYLAYHCLYAAPMATVHTVRVVDAAWDRKNLTDLFTELTRDSATFVPNLRSLSVMCTIAMEIPYAALAEMLTARRGGEGSGVARLESFELVLAPSPPFPGEAPTKSSWESDEDGLDTLRALAADGFNIRLRGLQSGVMKI